MASKASPHSTVSTSRSSKISNDTKPVSMDPSRKMPTVTSSNINSNANATTSTPTVTKTKALIKTVGSEKSSSPKLITPDKRPSVRAVISNIEKKTPSLSRHGQGTQEDILKTKEKLVLSEKSNHYLKKEVAEYKKQVENLTSELQNAIEGSRRDRFHAEEIEKATQSLAGLCQGELEAMKNQYVLDLQKYQIEMEELKRELHIYVEEKNEAVRLASEAMNVAESRVEKRAENISAEALVAENVSDLESVILATLDTMEELKGRLVQDLDLCKDESKAVSEQAFEDNESTDLSEHKREEKDSKYELENIKFEKGKSKDLSEEYHAIEEDESKTISAPITFVEEKSIIASENTLEEVESKNISEPSTFKEVESKNTSENTCHKGEEHKETQKEATTVSDFELMDLKKKFLSLLAELQVSKETEEKCKLKIAEQGLEVDYLYSELMSANELKRELALQVSSMESTIGQLKIELRDAKEAEENGSVNGSHFKMHDNSVNTELLSFSSSSMDVSNVREAEAAEENVVKLSVEESVLLTFLESLVAELAKKQDHIGVLLKKEAHESMESQVWKQEMARIIEENNHELMLLSKQLASANAEKESLKAELGEKISELASAVMKETTAIQSASDLQNKLEDAQIQLARIMREESALSERHRALMRQMDFNNKELSDLREREKNMASIVSAIKEELELKNMEEVELRKAVSSSNKRCFALSSELDRTQSEVLQLRRRGSDTCVKLAALCVVLTNISKRNEKRIHELERDLHAQSSELNDELIRMKMEFEKTLDLARVAREDEVLCKDKARDEIETLKEQLILSKAKEEEILKELQDVMQENDSAWEEIESLRRNVTELETKSDVQGTQEMKQELEMLRMEMIKLRKEKEMAEITCKSAEDRIEVQLESLKQQRESSLTMMDCIVSNEKELSDLRIKLTNAEAEVEEAKANGKRSQRELDNYRTEEEAKERQITELRQHLADTEKAKLNLEGEVQRLLEENKKLQVVEVDSMLDIPIHSEGPKGYSIPERREEKPQADNAQMNRVVLKQSSSLSEAIRRADSGLRDYTEAGLTEQLSCLSMRRDDVTFHDELISLPSEEEEEKKKKKKKKSLLTRLGTLLDKKKP